MGRLLFWLGLAVAVFIGYQWMRRQRRARGVPPTRPTDSDASESMVRCAVCDVAVPRSEALVWRDRVYCGEPHRLRDERDPA